MSFQQFISLYIICLIISFGTVEAAKFVRKSEPEPEKSEIQRAIAIPPRPEGVRKPKSEVEGEGTAYTEQACNKHTDQLRDICFQQLARQRADKDLAGGISACNMIRAAKLKWECMADVAELYASFDRTAAMQVCPDIEIKKWRDQCVFGIALALSEKDPQWAFRTCDSAGQWRDFCRHDVNGEISVFNLEMALSNCAKEEGDILTRKTCWHGIGKYIARVDISAAFSACDRVPDGPENLYRENCFHGVGWGGAEGVGSKFVSSCGRAGVQKDSCLLGVAYNLKRLKPEEGMKICAQVQRNDLRVKCESFVGQGIH